MSNAELHLRPSPALLGLGLVGAFGLAALAAPLLAPYDSYRVPEGLATRSLSPPPPAPFFFSPPPPRPPGPRYPLAGPLRGSPLPPGGPGGGDRRGPRRDGPRSRRGLLRAVARR